MTNELLISIGALVVALISALYAVRSTQIARRALSISEEEFQSKKEGLSLYLIEGINYITEKEKLIFGFNLSVTNKATSPNAIQRIELLISFVRADNSVGSIILQHDQNLKTSIKGHEVSPFKNSMEIAPKSAITNWCLFLCDSEFHKFGRIDKYTIRVTDSSGAIYEVTSYLIKEYRIV